MINYPLYADIILSKLDQYRVCYYPGIKVTNSNHIYGVT